MEDHLAKINDPGASLDVVVSSMLALGEPIEPASFWSAIANNKTFQPQHRRLAIYQLFRRHVPLGTTVRELGLLLEDATWLSESSISEITALGGKIPVNWTSGDTILLIELLPAPDRYELALYVRIAGAIKPKDFKKALISGKGKEQVFDSTLLEFAFHPKDPLADR